MANTTLVERSGWLESLLHLFCLNKRRPGVAHIEVKAFRLFRQFLALKIAIPFAFVDGIHWPINAKAVAIFLVILIVGLPRYCLAGLLIILGLAFKEFLHSWPFTINHTGLEFGIVLLMCLVPEDQSKQSRISCADMVKTLMLSVWFYSGLHKLFDGYYWNAEFFALEALSYDAPLGHHLNSILNFFGPLTGSSHEPFVCCTQGILGLSNWQISILLVLSWLTILIEILVPVSFIMPKFRPFGIITLFIFQGFTTYFSGEIDFAFTAFAILFLFIPRLAPYTYASLAIAFLLVQPWI